MKRPPPNPMDDETTPVDLLMSIVSRLMQLTDAVNGLARQVNELQTNLERNRT
jgi:hypothetical protein